MSSNPTIVIVPGSFATPNAYLDIVTRLRSQSFPALEIVLPSTQMRPGMKPATMQEDAARVRAVVEALHAQGKEVVVLCHSYGGAPATQALAGMKVKRIVYLAAEAPKVGQSVVDALSGPSIDGMMASAVNGYMHTDPVLLASFTLNDIDNWDYAFECAQKLQHHSAASFTEPVMQIGYADSPVSYILTEKDLIVAPDFQEQYIKNIEEAQGKKIDVVRKPWGHCPTWSAPEEFVKVLIAEARK